MPRKTKGCTMPIQPGEFWVADIPFTSGGASKKRPVLVLWLDGLDAVVAAVTSAAPRSPTDVIRTDWKLTGLHVPSTGVGARSPDRAPGPTEGLLFLRRETCGRG